jgi:hypothetical protein
MMEKADLRKLVEKYNLTAADVAYHATVSKDTAKAYLSNPESKRYRKIPDSKLKLIELFAKRELEAGKSLHEEFEQLSGKLKALIEEVFGYTEKEIASIRTSNKGAAIGKRLTSVEAAREFFKLTSLVEDMHIGFCSAWRNPEDLSFLIRQEIESENRLKKKKGKGG